MDDDEDTREILSHLLESEGFFVLAAGSGAEALQMARQPGVAAILLDLMMPGTDGFAVCRALKSRVETAEIPVIIVTARNDIDTRAEALRLGVADFLVKPVSRLQLVNVVAAQLEIIRRARATDFALRRLGDTIGRRRK